MKKLENFSNCLTILKNADFNFANESDIYRTGIIGQFNLTFELAWKALKYILQEHGVSEAETGSPKECLQLGYQYAFIDDMAVWLMMLKKRNTAVQIYDEETVEEMIIMIRDSFIPAFVQLERAMQEKDTVTAP